MLPGTKCSPSFSFQDTRSSAWEGEAPAEPQVGGFASPSWCSEVPGASRRQLSVPAKFPLGGRGSRRADVRWIRIPERVLGGPRCDAWSLSDCLTLHRGWCARQTACTRSCSSAAPQICSIGSDNAECVCVSRWGDSGFSAGVDSWGSFHDAVFCSHRQWVGC